MSFRHWIGSIGTYLGLMVDVYVKASLIRIIGNVRRTYAARTKVPKFSVAYFLKLETGVAGRQVVVIGAAVAEVLHLSLILYFREGWLVVFR